MEHREISAPRAGKFNVHIEGDLKHKHFIILTVHDLGCNHTMWKSFLQHPSMAEINKRAAYIHVDVPGQEDNAPDLPADYNFPSMQSLGEDLVCILDQLDIKQVVGIGEGAGANIVARFAMAQPTRVLGVCLIHCTGTTAGIMEGLKDKLIGWKLEHLGMNPTAEAYLMMHRFGSSCPRKHIKHRWCSQPLLNNGLHSGDLMIAAAVLCSGNNFSKVELMAKILKLHFPSQSSFTRMQRTYLVPAIEEKWDEHLRSFRAELEDKDVVLLGDGRMDSPGHCAKYCTYSMMENDSKKIIAIETLDKREVGKKSTNMEKAGFQRALEDVRSSNNVTEVVTDAHLQIGALMKRQYPQIKHSHDIWHAAKNLGKKIVKAGQEKSCRELLNWSQDIVNHFWHCSKMANTHEEFLFEKAKDQEELNKAINSFQQSLRKNINAQNLKRFVKSFMKRSNIAEQTGKMKCPVLLVTGALASFNHTVHTLAGFMLAKMEKNKVEIIEVEGVANVLEENPDRLAEAFLYFCQGLGVIGGVPMPRMTRANSAENPEILTRRTRSLSMEEADKPLGIYSSSPGRVGSPIKPGTSPGKGTLSTSPPS